MRQLLRACWRQCVGLGRRADALVCWMDVVDGTLEVVRLGKMPSVGLRAKISCRLSTLLLSIREARCSHSQGPPTRPPTRPFAAVAY